MTPSRGIPWRARPRSSTALEAGLGDQVHLVHDRTRHRHAVLLEERGVEHDLVDGPADAPLADDHGGRAQEARHDRVRQPDDRADARVAGPLDEHQLLRPGQDRVGPADPRAQVLHHVTGDVRLREAARDVDGAHDVVWVRQTEDRLHEHGVLVGGDPGLVGDRALADGLRKACPEAGLEERVDETQRGRGLAAVLARRGEVQVAHAGCPARRYGRVGAVANGLARMARAMRANTAMRMNARRRFRRAARGDGAAGPPGRDRGRRRAGRRPPRGLIRGASSSLDQGDRLLEARDRLGIDGVRLEVWPEPFEDVADEAQEDARVGHEELRLVVVPDERQATLEDAPVFDVGDLGGGRVSPGSRPGC